jgi:hypothetical protein
MMDSHASVNAFESKPDGYASQKKGLIDLATSENLNIGILSRWLESLHLLAETRSLDDTFETETPLVESRARIISAILERKGVLSTDTKLNLVAKLGSETKTRLAGGMLLDRSIFPREIVVSLRESPRGTQITVIVKDTLGSVVRYGMRSKYKRIMSEDMAAMKSKFPDAHNPERTTESSDRTRLYTF